MDDNKLAKLKAIGYTIPKTCGFCKHADFVGNSDYGSCTKFEYEHLKHSDAKRHLSIYRGGACPSFEVHPPKAPYDKWMQFVV